MCGITDWFFSAHWEPRDEVLAAMSDSIRHRDPDNTGDFRDPAAGVALAHRRLSIFDLTDAIRQPPQRGIARAYNRRFHNFRALCAELI